MALTNELWMGENMVLGDLCKLNSSEKLTQTQVWQNSSNNNIAKMIIF